MTDINADLLVIGWGKAGKTLAKRYAASGKHVVLVERSPQMYGGTCINVACVPTKDLVVSSEERRATDDPQEYFVRSVAERDALIGRLNAANHAMLEGSVTLIDGVARFTGPHAVTAATADGDVTIEATHIIIGTGTTPARPDLPGIDLPHVYDSTTIQHAEPFPQRLVVIGGGFIGLEFASMFHNFGAQVTILDRGDTFLPRLEPLVSAEVNAVLTGRGIDIRQNASVDRIEPTDTDALRVILGDDAIETDAVLVAVGRTPATADLALDAAGIETDARGFVVVDDHLRTNVPGVWAVGDVNGGPQFTYISMDDHRIVFDQLVGKGERNRADRVAVPSTTYITPPIGQVGLTPQQAREAGHDVLYAAKKVATIAAMPRPKILGQPEGIITFTADATTRKILGSTWFSVDTQEVINLVALGIRLGATIEDLRDGIWTHPSSTEALNEVLGELKPFEG